MDWQGNEQLRHDLEYYVKLSLKRCEILDYMFKNYPQYPWSLSTLARRLSYFNLRYIDYTTSIQDVEKAIKLEISGPGKLLGYRAMNQKLRIGHGIKVPRHLTYHAMQKIDPFGLQRRKPRRKEKLERKNFVSKGPMWTVSVDGHDKLCGYQNHTFPLAVYGCIDTFSRKVLYLSVLHTNSNPLVIGKTYLSFIYKSLQLPKFVRMDRGTETGKLASIHAYLSHMCGNSETNATDFILYGPSTSNKIERWWRELHERLEKYFKPQIKYLLEAAYYNPHSELDRKLLYYIFQPVISRECDLFVEYWNSHRIRQQADIELPTGVPNHMFDFPEKYGATFFGAKIPSKNLLKDVAALSGVLNAPSFLDDEFKERCKLFVVDPDILPPHAAKEAYCLLKRQF